MAIKKITWEMVRLRFRNSLWLPATRDLRAKGLKVREFTIISNNCWGGTVYESYGLPKQTPTIGMFIMPPDYIKFCSDLRGYFAKSLEFVKPGDSKWRDVLGAKDSWGTYIIGRLGDIELQMLHYHDEEMARAKWNRRVSRIHWDRMIVKLNDQNGATEEDLRAFDELPLNHKVVFAAKEHSSVRCCTRIHCPRSCDFIPASYEPFGRNLSFDTTKYINNCFTAT